jgi:hypothetical protein
MRLLLRVLLAGLFCAAAAGAGVYWLVELDSSGRRPPRPRARKAAALPSAKGQGTTEGSPKGRPPEPQSVLDVINDDFEDGGFGTASKFQAPPRDASSLAELRQAVAERGRRGIAQLTAELDALRLDSPPTKAQAIEKVGLEKRLGMLHMYEGQFDEAARWIEKALKDAHHPEVFATTRNDLRALLGIIALRRGELDNCVGCVGPSSCIFPIATEAAHTKQAGSREAIRWFTAYLEEAPRDLRVIWLLNLAYMTLGEYPQGVPRRFLIPIGIFGSELDPGRFENVAQAAGLGVRGPNVAGGSLFDDFTGDGLPDLFTTSLDVDRGASFFVNRGDGTFDDRSDSAGLAGQVYALNLTRADFDNDGHLDVLLLRGGWEKPARMSLLRNQGDGTFADVTEAAGLDEPIATEAAAWGDYNNDGWIDVYVCGEYLPALAAPSDDARPDPRNLGRLYRNRGDGTFQDVAEAAGVLNERCGKGACWGDYDDDGRLDLFVSNRGQAARLYHNEGDGTFRDLAESLGVTGPSHGFACWFWDFDNDGRLDLFVCDYQARGAEILASLAGTEIAGASRARLYANFGQAGFRDVSRIVGLERAMAPMGANFADIDNDGFLDVYFGTGAMAYGGLDRNLLYLSNEGSHFTDVTTSSGTGHLQKGHGVSFADYDGDGDLDLFVELGGAVPGDRAYNALFRNPGHGRHWLKIKLVGTKTNRAAIGAKLQADYRDADGTARSIHRTIGNNSSFGGNSLVETIGLRDATRVDSLAITWPTSGTTQTFQDLACDQAIEITEGSDSLQTLSPTGTKKHAQED